jgi:hypothetical protein
MRYLGRLEMERRRKNVSTRRNTLSSGGRCRTDADMDEGGECGVAMPVSVTDLSRVFVDTDGAVVSEGTRNDAVI